VRGYVRDLALGAAAVVLTVDPELVVLGGGFSQSADLLLEPLRAELARLVIRPPEVRVSGLGERAAALGAVRHALDHVEERFFTPETGPLDPL
jgi:predicted NBD/HSP70 family sugar kinase